MSKNRLPLALLCASVIIAPAIAAGAGDAGAKVDTSHWKCSYCVFPSGWYGDVDFGAGYISDDSAKFGDFTGMDKQGVYPALDLDVHWRGKDANYYDITGSNLGLDGRSLEIEKGKQGTYAVSLSYDRIPHMTYGDARTPFSGVGSDHLTLPPGWAPGATPATMSGLSAALHPTDLRTDRETVGLGLRFIQSDHWKYDAKFRHETRDGTQMMGASFLLTSSIVPAPVDYTTNQVEASATYSDGKLQATFGYYGSYFRNADGSLVWDNPFIPYVSGADVGQLTLAPDNNFHQLQAAASYRLGDSTWASGSVSVGRMTQDQNFDASTVNSNLLVATLPRTNLDGNVRTVNARGRISSRLTHRLQVDANYTYDQRDNQTPQNAYQQVGTDVYVGGYRTNTPFSFSHNRLGLDADYRLDGGTHLAAGYDHETRLYSYLGIDNAHIGTKWAEIRGILPHDMSVRLKYTSESRNVNGNRILSPGSLVQNPLLRQYNLADRDRHAARLSMDFSPTDTIGLGLNVQYGNDDYFGSEIGLSSGNQKLYSMDASYIPAESVNLHAFASWEALQSDMSNSQNFSVPDWAAHQEDLTRSAGFGAELPNIIGKLDLGLDFTYSVSHGSIDMRLPVTVPQLPDLLTRLNSTRIYGSYPVSQAFTVRAEYWIESYHSDDWSLDGVAPNTISNLLSTGVQSPDYVVRAVLVSVQYRL